jgi:hypothetical protein
MRVTRFDAQKPVQRGRLDTNTVARLDGIESFDALLTELDTLRAEHGPARIVCTLDDVNQCAYTSMHASEDERLWFDADENADPRLMDDARVASVAAALDDATLRVKWDALAGVRLPDAADVAGLVEINRDPGAVLDDVVLVQRVPVDRDDLVLAGIPNGYFTCDWDTFQNHAVVLRLAAHGYRHFGIGSALLGFDRETTPSADEARAVVADLVHLYGTPETTAWPDLAALLPSRRTLLLGYTEDFAEQVLS